MEGRGGGGAPRAPRAAPPHRLDLQLAAQPRPHLVQRELAVTGLQVAVLQKIKMSKKNRNSIEVPQKTFGGTIKKHSIVMLYSIPMKNIQPYLDDI